VRFVPRSKLVATFARAASIKFRSVISDLGRLNDQ
jgi:hypothetical protein